MNVLKVYVIPITEMVQIYRFPIFFNVLFFKKHILFSFKSVKIRVNKELNIEDE